jgi:hypothetical protein
MEREGCFEIKRILSLKLKPEKDLSLAGMLMLLSANGKSQKK